MKKIILVIAAVALLASPAMAVDWNFYGSARMATWYFSRDYNNSDPSDLDSSSVLTFPDDQDDDQQVQWDLQGNSRIGANVKAENISGQFEFAVTDSDVTTRRLYGIWDFGAGQLKVGQDYGPVTQFLSGQAFDTDAGLLGWGAAYGGREPQIELRFGGFKVAAIQNQGDGDLADGVDGGVVVDFDTGNVNRYVPRLEASYGMSMDTWNFTVLGGYQWYEIEDAGPNSKDIDVNSWIVGGDVGFNFGPAYIKAAGSIGTNWTEAGWSAIGSPIAQFDFDDDVNDVDLWQALLVGGFKMTDQLTFEVGFGYLDLDPDGPDRSSSSAWTAYGQAVISMAPGVWLIPEGGYQSFAADYGGTENDNGTGWYLGAKWQIDF